MIWFSSRVRWLAVAVVLAVVAGGCGDESSSPVSSSTVSSSTVPVDVVGGGGLRGRAVWPLVDAVPAFRKAGVLMMSGADYEPLLGRSLVQERALVTMNADRAVLAFAPERGGVVFDRIELGGFVGEADGWPFVITAQGDLVVFTAAAADRAACEALIDEDQPFVGFGIETEVEGRLSFAAASCGELRDAGGVVVGELAGPVSGVLTFGVLLRAEVAEVVETVVTIEWLALVDSTETAAEGPVVVEVVGREQTLSARSEDLDDDRDLDVLHVLRADGTSEEFAVGEDGSFVVEDLGTVSKLWIEDYGLQHFVLQGPWIDPDTLTRSLVIDATPTFETLPTPPTGSYQSQRPHELAIWNGGSSMGRQEYSGLNWNNNLGLPDRDRDPSNPNDCDRSAWLGGSYVAAIQTRVDQKPGLIAEALLDAGSAECHEVITYAFSLESVETHHENARRLVQEFGVTHLIFAISGNELCRMDDQIYTQFNEVALETPLNWRLIDGEMVAPVSRRERIEVESDPDFDGRSACSFSFEEGFDGAAGVMDKLVELTDLMQAFGPDVEVTYLVMKDVLAGSLGTADKVAADCEEVGLDCVVLPVPDSYSKPADLVAIDDNPHLFRYFFDGHPNPRANQMIAEALVDVVG